MKHTLSIKRYQPVICMCPILQSVCGYTLTQRGMGWNLICIPRDTPWNSSFFQMAWGTHFQTGQWRRSTQFSCMKIYRHIRGTTRTSILHIEKQYCFTVLRFECKVEVAEEFFIFVVIRWLPLSISWSAHITGEHEGKAMQPLAKCRRVQINQ